VTRWPSPGGGGSEWSPGLLDRAETFEESGLTLSTDDGADVVSEGVQATDYDAVTKNKEIGEGETQYFYFTFDLTIIDTIDVRSDAFDAEFQEVRIDGEQAGTTQREYDVSGYTGDIQTRVEIYNDGVSGSDWNVTVEPYGGPPVTRATGEWEMPNDVAAWDILPFQVAKDGATVSVYAIDPSDGSRLAGPLDDPGDISDIPNNVNVGFEVEFERTSSDQQPRLDAIYRRRKIT